MKNDDKVFFKLFRVKDNFGDYGICAVFSAEIKDKHLHVNDFMISCRALGRGVEDFIFNKITSIAKNKKLEKILFNYIKSTKNIPIRNFLIKKGVSIDTNQLLI